MILENPQDIEISKAFKKRADSYFSTFCKSYSFFKGKSDLEFSKWNKDFEAAKRKDGEYQELKQKYLAIMKGGKPVKRSKDSYCQLSLF